MIYVWKGYNVRVYYNKTSLSQEKNVKWKFLEIAECVFNIFLKIALLSRIFQIEIIVKFLKESQEDNPGGNCPGMSKLCIMPINIPKSPGQNIIQ